MCRSLEIYFLKTSLNHVAIFKTNFQNKKEDSDEDDDDDDDEERIYEVEG